MMKKSIFTLLVLVVAATLYGMYRIGMLFPNFETISPAQAYTIIRKDPEVVILDVRTPSEFSRGHLQKARLLPVQELLGRLSELEGIKNRRVIVYCRSGHRSAAASKILADHGYKPLNVEGGIMQWMAAGLPVVKE